MSETVPMDPRATEGPTPAGQPMGSQFPLTDLQAAYMVGKSQLMELGGRQNYYLEADTVDFDPVRAEQALNEVVRRHEHLRTLMLEEGEQRVMDLAQTPRVRIPVIDLTGLAHERQEGSLREIRERMCESGLQTTGWPLFEVVAARVRSHRIRLHIRMSLILLDGSSMRTVITDWLRLYKEPGVPLPPVEQSFRQWRLAQLAKERGDGFHKQWEYWKARLDSLPGAPQLPLDQQAGSIDRVWFHGRTTHLSRVEWQRFCANFRKHRVLPSTALLHVLAEALGAWAAEPRFCLNFVHQYDVAERRPGAQEIVGQRSATLPLEVDLSADDDFWVRAQLLQRRLWRDMANKDVTAVRISRELARRQGWTQRAALPYVFTNNQGPGMDSMPPGRPAFRLVERVQHTPQVLVDNQIRDAVDGGVFTNIDFVDEAFPQGLPDEIVAAYRRMLYALAAPDGASVQPHPVPAGHRATVARLNTSAGVPARGRLEDGFLAGASRTPGAAAVVCARRTLTYAELEARSRAVAHALLKRGIGRGDVVPVVMVKSWEQVAAVLGILRAGAAYCPVDARLPARRIRHLLSECGARTALVQSWQRPEEEATDGVELIDVDRADAHPAPLPAHEGDPDDLAYIIYTSGSTGLPKGVMIEHAAALNTIEDVSARIGMGPRDRVFGISSLSFDLSVWDIFGTLAAGAALVLPEPTARPDPVGWARSAHKHGVTVWNSVPALAEMLVEVTELRPELGKPPLRAFLLSGDWIGLSLPERMRRMAPEVRIIAMGGATEASIWSNIHEVGEVDPGWRSIPYGVPLRHQTMTVLDHRLAIRPAWAVGQIFIGGRGLSRGYWRDEERTADRFVHHPRTGERLYRTGDLGRYRPDGTIEFLGREDRQVKIQGFRVEPGEVEAVLRECADVRECVVCVEEVPGGQRRLAALVVPVEGSSPDTALLSARLGEQLPHYLVPGRIHRVERLPLTANGKVDGAKALRMLADIEAAAPVGVLEDSPLMTRLAELWGELLEVPGMNADSNFFEVGGNSLLALRMVSRVRQEFGTDLPVGRVFEAPTVRQLAAFVEHAGLRASCAVELADGPGEELFLFHILGGSVAHYIPLARAWKGPVRAFQSRALVEAGDSAFPPDLEAMAAGYREELLRLKPDGPFLLGGWSLGGNLAYEVARQLADQGHESAVFMLDSEIRDIHLPLTEADRHLGFLLTLALEEPPESAATALHRADPADMARVARGIAVERGLLPEEVDLAAYEHLKRVQEHELALLAAHRPGSLDQPVLLFVADEEPDRPDPVTAWRTVCPAIHAQSVHGDHFSLGRNLPDIADRVAAWRESLS